MAPHPDKALTPVRINAIKTKGRYADGNGLYLVVTPAGAKQWLLRTVVNGRRRDIGLGSLRLVTLAEAREKARHYRKMAREGGDPIAAKRKAQMTVPTFAEAARRVHADHSKAWRSKHEDQWINTLERHAFPVIGTRRVDQVETADILKILTPIWLTPSGNRAAYSPAPQDRVRLGQGRRVPHRGESGRGGGKGAAASARAARAFRGHGL